MARRTVRASRHFTVTAMLTAIAWIVILTTGAVLLATFIASWKREFDRDISEFQKGLDLMTIQEERQLRIQGEALLEAAVEICRRGLGEAASDVRLSVMHLTDGKWCIWADFDSPWAPKPWTNTNREELLEEFAEDGVGWISNCLRSKKGAKS